MSNKAKEAYPLSWPAGWARTAASAQQRARFTTKTTGGNFNQTREISLYAAMRRLTDELARLGASEIILSTNLELRNDGQPRTNQREPRDTGVAVYFRLKGHDRVLACDRWDKVPGNIAAIAAHIDTIRKQDRYGVGTIEQAFAGYSALPAPGAHAKRAWTQVLEISNEAVERAKRVKEQMPSLIESVKANYRNLIRVHHPDRGGDVGTYTEINEAWAEAQRELVSDAR